MTERLYYKDSKRLEFEAVLISSESDGKHFRTILDQSAFYPTSGGQAHDTGRLNGVTVIDVMEDESGEVVHLTSKPVGQAGEAVVGLVDKARRQRNCQSHTAQHIISAAAAKLYNYKTVSVHLGEEYGAVELETKTVTANQLSAIESMAQVAVQDNVPIDIIFASGDELAKLPLRKPPSRSGELRIIRIGEIDCSGCGGTHCVTSGGAGAIKIIGIEKIRGHVMIRFLAGQMAFDDYALRFGVSDELARSLTCHPKDLPGRFAALTADNKRLKRDLVGLQKQLLPIQAEELAKQMEQVGTYNVVVTVVSDVDSQTVSTLASMVADAVDGLALLCLDNRLSVAVSAGSGLHAGKLVKQLAELTGLRGGGNERLAQIGGAEATAIEEYRQQIHKLVAGE